jgi:hypothetical protein
MATCGYIIPEVDVKRLVVDNREGTDVYLSSYPTVGSFEVGH